MAPRTPIVRPKTPGDFRRVLKRADEKVPLWLLRRRLKARVVSPKDREVSLRGTGVVVRKRGQVTTVSVRNTKKPGAKVRAR